MTAAVAPDVYGPPVRRTAPSTGAARWIPVCGVSPSCGTSTVAALLSLAFAGHQRYRVVAVDAVGVAGGGIGGGDGSVGGVGGGLGGRLAVRPGATVAQLAAAGPSITSFATLSPYLHRNGGGPWAVTGPATEAPDAAQCHDAIASLSRFFAVGILDGGTIAAPAAAGLLTAAQAPLLTVAATVDDVLVAAQVLDWSARRERPLGTTAPATGVALVSMSPAPPIDVGRAARLLAERGGRVVIVPYDRSLAAGPIAGAAVSDAVWAAARRLGRDLLGQAAAAPPADGHR